MSNSRDEGVKTSVAVGIVTAVGIGGEVASVVEKSVVELNLVAKALDSNLGTLHKQAKLAKDASTNDFRSDNKKDNEPPEVAPKSPRNR